MPCYYGNSGMNELTSSIGTSAENSFVKKPIKTIDIYFLRALFVLKTKCKETCSSYFLTGDMKDQRLPYRPPENAVFRQIQ